MLLEVACFNLQSAQIAAKAGADRIEFCTAMELGGTTPSLDDFKTLKEQIQVPVYIMLRPRGGNFQYTKEELQLMEQSLVAFRKAGADGFVFGILDASGKVDEESCKQLIFLATGLPCTFHRAIDRAADIQVALETIIALGFQTVLSSGGAASALQGIKTLAKWQQNFGTQIDIMPAGGIRAANVTVIQECIQPKWVHSSGILQGEIANLHELRKTKQLLPKKP